MANQKKSSKCDRVRKSAQNLAYKAERRHEKSHVRRITKHLSRYGHDAAACAAILVYAQKIGVDATRRSQQIIDEVHDIGQCKVRSRMYHRRID